MLRTGPRDRDDADDADEPLDRRTFLAGVGSLVGGGALGVSELVGVTPGREPGPKTDELIVGFSPSVSDSAAAARAAVPDVADVVHSNETMSYATVSFPSTVPDGVRDRLAAAITAVDHVEYVEPNASLRSSVVPSDRDYSAQSAPRQVNCETAWETTLGSDDVRIAVVDQGVQYDHPDLESAADGPGEDFVGSGGDASPNGADERHGTHVAGIAAGATDNGVGTAGISNCSLLAARALGANGEGSLSDVADGIQWAADAGADVINVSFGASNDYRTLAAACEYALEQGALLIAAAGNAGADSVDYPAAYEDVLAVSALEGESLADFSNTGSEIDLAAPGTDILSAVPWDGYDRISGTSMAAPVVAGVAGLALSTYPDLSPADLRDHLRETATDLGLEATAQGAGRVDAAAAVETMPSAGRAAEAGVTGETSADNVASETATGDATGGTDDTPSRATVADVSGE